MVFEMDIAHTAREDLVAMGRLVAFLEPTNLNEEAPHDGLRHGGPTTSLP